MLSNKQIQAIVICSIIAVLMTITSCYGCFQLYIQSRVIIAEINAQTERQRDKLNANNGQSIPDEEQK
jgi:hypothetical protein